MEAAMPDENHAENGELNLPGFRFHPTEEELLGFYLKKRVQGHRFSFDIIRTLDMYRYDPWNLPGMANHRGEREWYFFVPRGRRCSAPKRSRLTLSGFWKATGSEKALRNRALERIGFKKTLVFYIGRAPGGNRTDWIMNEYRLPEQECSASVKNIVLCRIYKKAIPYKELEQRATMGYHTKPQKRGDFSDEEMPPMRSNSITECEVSPLNSDDDNGRWMNDGQSFMNGIWNENKLKGLQVEVPKVRVDSFFGQPIVSPWSTENTWTPSILFSTPKDYFLEFMRDLRGQ